MTETQLQDSLRIARPASIEAKLGATTLWKTGTHFYDRSGNLGWLHNNDEGGSDYFVYDKVSRLVKANLDVPQLTGSLIFADGLESGTTARWLDDWPPVSHPAQTIQEFTYDRFGNLLSMPIEDCEEVPPEF